MGKKDKKNISKKPDMDEQTIISEVIQTEEKAPQDKGSEESDQVDINDSTETEKHSAEEETDGKEPGKESVKESSEEELRKEEAEESEEKPEEDSGKADGNGEAHSEEEINDTSEIYEEDKAAEKSSRSSDTPKARKKSIIKKHGRKILVLAVLGIAVFIGSKIYSTKQAASALASMPQPEFREVERRDISNSIAVTATIEADDKRTVSTLVSNTRVLDVYYEVGDHVQQGDIICTFDTSSVSENIERLQKKMNVTSAKSKATIDEAHVEVDKSGTTWAYDAQDNFTSIQRLHGDYDRALVEYNVARDDYSDAVDTKDKRKEEYDDIKDDYEKWKDEYDKLSDEEKSGAISDNEEHMMIKKNYDYYSGLYNSAESAYKTAKSAVQTAESNVRSKDAALESARQKVEDADKKYPRDLLSDGVNVQGKARSEYVASLDASIANDENEKTMSEYEQLMDESVVRAPISGMITALNVHRGDEYAEKTKTDVCVIQDDSGYTVKGNVDQYNISSVTEGMRAVIKTQATGEEELYGTVKFVSPVPSKSTTVASQSDTSNSDSKSSDTKVAYPVEIQLSKRDSRLRLGMTAETSLVVDKRERVLVVPYDCITEDEYGYKCVFVEIPDDTKDAKEEEKASFISGIRSLFETPEVKEVKTKKVIVQTGLETDYYIEIMSDEIKEGDRVKVPEDEDLAGSPDDAAMLAVPDDSSAVVIDESPDGAMTTEGSELPGPADGNEGEEPSEGVSAGAGGI